MKRKYTGLKRRLACKHKNKDEFKSVSEISIIGEFNGYKVFVIKEDYITPIRRFYIVNFNNRAKTGRYFVCCVKIETCGYFTHYNRADILTNDLKQMLCDFLQDKYKNTNYNNWKQILYIWNKLNPKFKVDENLEIPNYMKLKYVSPFIDDWDTLIIRCIDDYDVYVVTRDNGDTPHFHIRRRYDDGKIFHTCIKIETPEYYYDDGEIDLLDDNLKKDLCEFLKQPTIWGYLLSAWNSQNSDEYSDITLDLNLPMPDYSLLPTK